jgi:release factor glutamine methyltransferase
VGADGTVTWRELWAETERLVGDRVVARWLCEEASGAESPQMLDVLDEPATERMVHHLDTMVTRVRAGEPVQYVLGHWPFRRLDLMVDRRVLIPRPETEQLVEHALRRARQSSTSIICADLGTGSGAIGLSLAAELPLDSTVVWLTDVSPDALDVARANAAGLGRRSVNVRFAEGSWFTALPADVRGRLQLVVANPPYVGEGDPEVERIVHDWEPAAALYAGADGLDEIRVIVGGAMSWLAPGGWLLLEIGHRHGPVVGQLLRDAGLIEVSIEPDLVGRDRYAIGRRPAG